MDELSDRSLSVVPTIGTFHNRLLVEVLLMGIDTDMNIELVLLIHQSHSYVTGSNETWWSKRIKTTTTIGNKHVSDRLNYIVFQSNL